MGQYSENHGFPGQNINNLTISSIVLALETAECYIQYLLLLGFLITLALGGRELSIITEITENSE